MKPTRYSISRQKACQQCSVSKAKCDRLGSGCSRCVQRALPCIYPRAASPRAKRSAEPGVVDPTIYHAVPHNGDISEGGLIRPNARPMYFNAEENIGASSVTSSGHRHPTDPNFASFQRSNGPDIREFGDLRLTCPINAEDISNRWLGAYIPLPDQKVKEYPTPTKTFLYRMLNSYIAIPIRGRGHPPFIHASQVASHLVRPPLSTCLSLVRICEHQLPGSEEAAAEVLQREMTNLHSQHGAYDNDLLTLLCAFQAHLILTMVLFFRLGQIANPHLRKAMMDLQELACASAKKGLVCEAEQSRIRPKWESWIVAEANRRTLYAMYLFDGVLSAHDGLPTFLGTELRGLPAPASRELWRARERSEWEAEYNSHLADWREGGLRIDELWRVPEDLDDAGVRRRQERVDRWLESVDEFGTMLYAVTSSTHG